MHGSHTRLARNVFEILGKLPRHGLGSRLTRNSWKDDSFWTITQVKMSSDGKHGKAFGVLTWRGKAEDSEAPREVRGPLKKVWRQIGAPVDGSPAQAAWTSLAAAAFQSENAAPAVEEVEEVEAESSAPAEESQP